MKDGSGRLQDHWRVLLLWTLVLAAGFYACLQDPVLDDLAGSLIVLYMLQLPALSAAGVAAAQPPAPLPTIHAIGFAAMIAIPVGYACFVLFLLIGSTIWEPAFLELRPAALGLLAGITGLIIALAVGLRRHRKEPHPEATRRSLRQLSILCVVLWVVSAVVYFTGSVKGVIWFGVALPGLWLAPMWFVLPPRDSVPRAVVHSGS